MSTSTGVVDLAASTPGSYPVINTIAAVGGCSSAADTVFIDIQPYTFTGQVSSSASASALCNGNSVNLFSSGTSYLTVLERETFNSALTPWTTVNSSSGGTPANAAWTLRSNNWNQSG
ncbi:MAG: hypothetical protein ACKOSR_13270, partial [Flavobacteriales bacterium]